jgi:maltose O-acetyltransferase
MEPPKASRAAGRLLSALGIVVPENLPTFFKRFELLEHAFAKLARDQELPPSVIARKAMTYVESMALSALYLHNVDRVGKRARARGRPFIENAGHIYVGDDFQLVSLFVRSHLVTGHDAVLEIGNAVNINFGAAISARQSVKIGNHVRIGPYCVIMDSDYHSVREGEETNVQPIVIDDDVWLAGRVSVLRGAHIGQGAVITAGSVVTGEIPPRVVAGGVPARVLRRREEGDPSLFSWQSYSEPASRRSMSPMSVRAVSSAPPSARMPPSPRIPPTTPVPSFAAMHPPLNGNGNGWNGSLTSDAPPHSMPAMANGPITGFGPYNGSSSNPPADVGSVADAVEDVFRELFGLEGPVDPSWSSNDIPKWDSLGQLRLLHLLEERFAVSIPEFQLVNMSSVGRVCSIVQECIQQSP